MEYLRYAFSVLPLDFEENNEDNLAGEGVEKREPSYTVGGNVNW